jgi:hypothetical protein
MKMENNCIGFKQSGKTFDKTGAVMDYLNGGVLAEW